MKLGPAIGAGQTHGVDRGVLHRSRTCSGSVPARSGTWGKGRMVDIMGKYSTATPLVAEARMIVAGAAVKGTGLSSAVQAELV